MDKFYFKYFCWHLFLYNVNFSKPLGWLFNRRGCLRLRYAVGPLRYVLGPIKTVTAVTGIARFGGPRPIIYKTFSYYFRHWSGYDEPVYPFRRRLPNHTI